MAKDKFPAVFIGSSSEGLSIAEAIQQNLNRDCDSTIWHQGLFGLSRGTLETLVERAGDFDFAILVLTPDDMIESRGKSNQSPRDNVLLEIGLFIGTLGRERTFIVYDQKADIKMPSDLAGVSLAGYRLHSDGNIQASVGPACTQLRMEIKQGGFRKQTAIAQIQTKTGNESLEHIARHIVNYLKAREFEMVSFERIRENINSSYTDQLLMTAIDQLPNLFRRVKLKGNKPGIGLVKNPEHP